MRVLKTVTLMVLAAALCVCTSAVAQNDLGSVSKVKDYYAEWLSSVPGVTNVGVGAGPTGMPEIELHADVITEQMRQLPHELNGFPVRIIRNPRYPGDPPLPDDAQAAGDEDDNPPPANEDSSNPMSDDAAGATPSAAPSTVPTMPPPGLR